MLDYNTYKQLRAKYQLSASQAARYARQESTPDIDWEDSRTGKQATLELDSFTVTIQVHDDYDYDWLDSRGKFTDRWEDGAIENPESQYNNRVYKYFVPANSEESHYNGLRDLNYSRTEAHELARSYVLQDMKIAADPNQAGYYAVYVTASAYLKGVELGTDSLYGIELKYNDKDSDSYLNETSWEIAHQAVSEAKSNLEQLRED